MVEKSALDDFVRAFEILDDRMVAREEQRYGDISSLLVKPWPESGLSQWRPIQNKALGDARERFYSRVPGTLPPLYESLILSYCWAEVDLGRLRLLENLPPVPDGVVSAITADPILFDVLTDGQLVQFAKGPDLNYDPVCFDLSRKRSDGECPIVRLDHEAILNHGRLVIVTELASSFGELVDATIQDSRSTRTSSS